MARDAQRIQRTIRARLAEDLTARTLEFLLSPDGRSILDEYFSSLESSLPSDLMAYFREYKRSFDTDKGLEQLAAGFAKGQYMTFEMFRAEKARLIETQEPAWHPGFREEAYGRLLRTYIPNEENETVVQILSEVAMKDGLESALTQEAQREAVKLVMPTRYDFVQAALRRNQVLTERYREFADFVRRQPYIEMQRFAKVMDFIVATAEAMQKTLTKKPLQIEVDRIYGKQ